MPDTAEKIAKTALINQVIKDSLLALALDERKIDPIAEFVEDMGMDALDLVELVMLLEERFHIEISDEDAEKWHILRDLEAYLYRVLPATVS